MTPTSQTIGVGGTVVFVVSVSGGAAGEAASWTCESSDPSKATVSKIPVGCQAMAVAVGGATIYRRRDEGWRDRQQGRWAHDNRGRRLSLPPWSLSSINDRDQEDEVLSEQGNRHAQCRPFGDQVVTQLSVLVDGVDGRYAGRYPGLSVAVPRRWRPWWAWRPWRARRANGSSSRPYPPSTCRFNSAKYDEVTGEPTYVNGERTIQGRAHGCG